MASIIRIGITKLVGGNNVSILPAVCKLQIQVRSISSKCLRSMTKSEPKPKPWDYENKSFTLLNYLYDKTSKRFDENSKIIVVEGPVASGKSNLAKQIAEELDMLYFPEANLDMLYINPYGYNMKQLDDQLPEMCKSFDVNNFLVNPKHKLSTAFQFAQYQIKVSQYIDALAHIFSTGQGIVLDRCAYSDFVFLEAMHSQGYISKQARSFYYEVRKNTIGMLLKPHLVIYLDTPVNKVLENIKKRNIGYEVKSPVLTTDYLCTMERFYKQEYLKTISEHAELLVYDWSEEGDVDIVVEDIERIDFSHYEAHTRKMADWDLNTEEDYAVLRRKYADKKGNLMTYFNVPLYDVPEMLLDADDYKIKRDVWESAPGMKYEKGFNTTMGDGSWLLKGSRSPRGSLPKIDRQISS